MVLRCRGRITMFFLSQWFWYLLVTCQHTIKICSANWPVHVFRSKLNAAHQSISVVPSLPETNILNVFPSPAVRLVRTKKVLCVFCSLISSTEFRKRSCIVHCARKETVIAMYYTNILIPRQFWYLCRVKCTLLTSKQNNKVLYRT
jgi:hypothetical protein